MMSLQNKKVLVTGGAGFIGSVIVRKLLKKGAYVTVLDNLYTGMKSSLPKNSAIKFVKGDVENKQLVDNLIKEHKLIIHAAARNIIDSTKKPYEDCQTNVIGTLNLLLAAKKYGVEKFVYTSSASVYGNPNKFPISEHSLPYTLTPYSVSKLTGENYCICMHESYNMPISVIRYSNVFGVEPRTPYTGVIANFFIAAIGNKPLKIHGDGEQTRDFNYVEDAADATILVLCNNKSTGMIFNVGTGIETSINVLAKKIIKITGSSSTIEYTDKRDIDNIKRRSVNIEKIQKVLCWSPKFTVDTGLKEIFKWYKKNNIE